MKKFWTIICIIIALVIIDQGAKIAIDRFYEYDAEALSQVKDTFHIHPLVNYETPDKLAQRAEKTGLPVTFWRIEEIFECFISIILFVLFVWCCYKISVLAGIKTHYRLVITLIILFFAVGICGICDRIFWDGTHDFLCISKSFIAETGKAQIMHASSDIKDWYLRVQTVLLVVYYIMFAFNIIKFSKDKEAFFAFKTALKERLKKIFRTGNKRKTEDQNG